MAGGHCRVDCLVYHQKKTEITHFVRPLFDEYFFLYSRLKNTKRTSVCGSGGHPSDNSVGLSGLSLRPYRPLHISSSLEFFS